MEFKSGIFKQPIFQPSGPGYGIHPDFDGQQWEDLQPEFRPVVRCIVDKGLVHRTRLAIPPA
jgi:hypothetical protein